MDDGALKRAEADLALARNALRRLESQVEEARLRVLKLEYYIEMSKEYATKATPEATTGGVSGAAVRIATLMIKLRGRPIRTRELIEPLRERGVSLGGGDVARDVVNLSGYLSRAEHLVNDRATGWSLKEWGGHPPGSPEEQPDVLITRMPEPEPVRLDIGRNHPGRPSDLDDDIPF